MKKSNKLGFNFIITIILSVFTLIVMFAIYWVIVTSLKDNSDFRKNFFGVPSVWMFKNYISVFENFVLNVTRDGFILQVSLFPDIIVNSLLYTVGGSFIFTLTPCFVAYAVAKFDCKFSKFLYFIVIVTMALPIIGNQPAMIDLLYSLGLYDNILGVWLQKFNFLGMYFLVFYASYKSLPKDYSEAAYIDGASEWRVLLQIMFPLVKSIFLTIFVLHFIELWNDYSVPVLYLPSHPTIAYGVWRMSNSVITGMSTAPMKMTACAIMVIPTIIIFLVFRERLMKNLSLGGLKE